LARKLQYAGWSISPALFRALSFGLGVALALGTLPYLDFFMAPFVAFAGPCLMNVLLRRSIERRTRRFSDDYPQLLMMAVALLKTGLPPTSALEAAARGLEGHSLVRSEVFAMLERMRMGLPEEKSIGVFGESISHPEIELFVQSLLLGLRVGGSLTDSLERLSTQARRREYFKRSAVASVAQQRGSMVAITLIMLALSSFLAVCAPAMASGLYRHPLGFKVIEVAAIVLLCAVGWLQQITRIRL
jgi:tight adherence protein B